MRSTQGSLALEKNGKSIKKQTVPYTDYKIIKLYSLEQTVELEIYSFSPTSSPTKDPPAKAFLRNQGLQKHYYQPGSFLVYVIDRKLRSYEVICSSKRW